MKISTFLVATGLILTIAGAAGAQSETDMNTPASQSMPAMSQTVSGTINTVGEASLVITTEDGRTMTLAADANSHLTPGLSAGQKVRVEYRTQTDGSYLASNVTVEPGSSPSRAAGSNSETGQQTRMSGMTDDQSTASSTTSSSGSYVPQTASPVPLIGLCGLLTLGGALGVRAFLRRP